MSDGWRRPLKSIGSVTSMLPRIVLTLGATLAAAGVNLAISPGEGPAYPLVSFYFAVAAVAWFGGFWPGIATTVCGVVIGSFAWSDSVFAERRTLALILFSIVGVVVSALMETLSDRSERERQARRRAKQAEDDSRLLAGDARVSRERLALEVADMTRLHNLSVRLLKQDDLAFVLHQILEAAIELLGADKGIVRLYDEQAGVLRVVTHVGFDSGFF